MVPLIKITKNIQERILLCSMIIFSFVFMSAFTSTMVSTLVVPKFIPNINTIEQLTNTNITVWTTSYEYNLLKNTLQGPDYKLLEKLRTHPDLNGTTSLYVSLFQNKSGFLMRYERAREFLKITKKFGKIR